MNFSINGPINGCLIRALVVGEVHTRLGNLKPAQLKRRTSGGSNYVVYSGWEEGAGRTYQADEFNVLCINMYVPTKVNK